MKIRLITIGLSVLVCVVVVLAQAQAPTPNSDLAPFLGTWKLNLAKSKFSPGPAPQSQLLRWTLREDGFVVSTFGTVDSQGNPGFQQTVFKVDGKEYPTYTQATLATFLANGTKGGINSYKRIDARTIEITVKGPTGALNNITMTTLSADGKTMTQTQKGGAPNAQGQILDNLIVREKQ